MIEEAYVPSTTYNLSHERFLALRDGIVALGLSRDGPLFKPLLFLAGQFYAHCWFKEHREGRTELLAPPGEQVLDDLVLRGFPAFARRAASKEVREWVQASAWRGDSQDWATLMYTFVGFDEYFPKGVRAELSTMSDTDIDRFVFGLGVRSLLRDSKISGVIAKPISLRNDSGECINAYVQCLLDDLRLGERG